MDTEIKEQKVFKNDGKIFEEDFKESFGPHIWAYRPPDNGGGQMARFTHESLCDLMAYNTKTKNFFLMELKSTLGTSISFRPYGQCAEYERVKKEFEEWNSKLTAKERKPIKDEIQEHKGIIRAMYKETNQAMIKYHQIKNLIENEEVYGIKGYLLFTFFRTTKTYAVPIKTFEEFWKSTSKKSINEKDLDKMVEKNTAYAIPQDYKGRSKRSEYEVDFLVE